MFVKNIMKKKVITLSPEDSIVKVLRTFSKNHISGVPVVKKNKLVGIITDSDIIANLDIHTPKVHFSTSPDFILLLAGLKSKKGLDEIEMEMKILKRFKVRDFMNVNVLTANPEDTITDVARLIHEKKITRVPIINKKEKVVGLVARQDLIRALTEV